MSITTQSSDIRSSDILSGNVRFPNVGDRTFATEFPLANLNPISNLNRNPNSNPNPNSESQNSGVLYTKDGYLKTLAQFGSNSKDHILQLEYLNLGFDYILKVIYCYLYS